MQFISILILQKSVLTGEKARQALAEVTGWGGTVARVRTVCTR